MTKEKVSHVYQRQKLLRTFVSALSHGRLGPPPPLPSRHSHAVDLDETHPVTDQSKGMFC